MSHRRRYENGYHYTAHWHRSSRLEFSEAPSLWEGSEAEEVRNLVDDTNRRMKDIVLFGRKSSGGWRPSRVGHWVRLLESKDVADATEIVKMFSDPRSHVNFPLSRRIVLEEKQTNIDFVRHTDLYWIGLWSGTALGDDSKARPPTW